MLVWTAGMHFIGRPLSYASVKLRPFSPVSPRFPPTMNFCFFNLSFLSCSCAKSTAMHGSEENYKTLAVRSVFPHNSHSSTFLLFLFPATPPPPPPPLKHPPPCWGWRAVGACFRSPPFLTAEHELWPCNCLSRLLPYLYIFKTYFCCSPYIYDIRATCLLVEQLSTAF